MLLLCGTVVSLSAQDFSDFAKKVTEFTLPNGLHFILAERHEAPVVSFHTYVKAGSVNDPSGQTGLAHMFEHMAFKGTETIGTRDWPQRKEGARTRSRRLTTGWRRSATRAPRPIRSAL